MIPEVDAPPVVFPELVPCDVVNGEVNVKSILPLYLLLSRSRNEENVKESKLESMNDLTSVFWWQPSVTVQ